MTTANYMDDHTLGMHGNVAKVSFRVVGADVDPEAVTAMLEIMPSSAHARGQPFPRRPERRRPTGAWVLESSLPDTTVVDEQMRQLLAVLEPQEAGVRRVTARGWGVGFLCGFFLDRSQGTIDLDPDTVRRMAALGSGLAVYVFDMQDKAGEES